MNIQELVEREERELQALEKERDSRILKADTEIQRLKDGGETQFGQLAKLQEKRESAAQFYESILMRRRDALTIRKGELAAQQKEQADKQQAEADKQERLAKARARSAYPGTDLEFSAAWPSIWARLRENQAVRAASKEPERVVVHI